MNNEWTRNELEITLNKHSGIAGAVSCHAQSRPRVDRSIWKNGSIQF